MPCCYTQQTVLKDENKASLPLRADHCTQRQGGIITFASLLPKITALICTWRWVPPCLCIQHSKAKDNTSVPMNRTFLAWSKASLGQYLLINSSKIGLEQCWHQARFDLKIGRPWSRLASRKANLEWCGALWWSFVCTQSLNNSPLWWTWRHHCRCSRSPYAGGRGVSSVLVAWGYSTYLLWDDGPTKRPCYNFLNFKF